MLAGSSGVTSGYTIDQSIRFNKNDNAYMSKTPSAASDGGKTYTYSWWHKRGSAIGSSSTSEYVIHTDLAGGNSADYLYFYEDGFRSWHGTNNLISIRLFRDASAWYHFVYVYDSTQTIANERIRFYVNGERQTNFSTENYPSLNATSYFNTNTAHYIGGANSSANRLDSYLAEIQFIDGYGYGPEYFGETNENGIWIPKEYTGSYGTNGFHIDGRDSSDLGDDESGNGNDYSTSGLAANDQKTDSPTNNHCTWNPLTGSAQVYSDGNLNAATASSAWKGGLTTMQVPLNSGIWYYELYVDSAGSSSGQFSIGWSESDRSITDDNSSGDTQGWVTYAINGKTYNNASSTVSYGATYTTGDVIGCKIDTDSSSNNITFYKNGASQGNLSEAFNAGYSPGFISPYILLYGTRNGTARFAYNEWTQTPSGITEANAINSVNLGAE
jgi:hypothetical protein